MKFLRELYCWITRGHSWAGATKPWHHPSPTCFWCGSVKRRKGY